MSSKVFFVLVLSCAAGCAVQQPKYCVFGYRPPHAKSPYSIDRQVWIRRCDMVSAAPEKPPRSSHGVVYVRLADKDPAKAPPSGGAVKPEPKSPPQPAPNSDSPNVNSCRKLLEDGFITKEQYDQLFLLAAFAVTGVYAGGKTLVEWLREADMASERLNAKNDASAEKAVEDAATAQSIAAQKGESEALKQYQIGINKACAEVRTMESFFNTEGYSSDPEGFEPLIKKVGEEKAMAMLEKSEQGFKENYALLKKLSEM